ncbi:type II secretion system protein N [Alteromonas sp. C1M14]|uniref:type II secretion system protein N n=1 Tax=Alteromonas sp. C1M14 TaxID=2841567 RepID=UPI001C094368|nr:type II secretion system protein N [Alteromonas sp. C1M14]MBU2978325.1 type II secretion system protein N [Alteromonas sp. C1M14]
MKAKILWTFAAVVVFLFFVVLYMPASQVINPQMLPKNVNIYGVSGTVWHGKAQAVVIDGIPVTDVAWDIAGFPLLIGQLSADVKGGNLRDANEVSFKGAVNVSAFSPEQVNADDVLLFLPVDRILAHIQLPLPVDAGGRFRVRLDDFSFGPECQSMAGHGDWLNATVAGTRGPIDFGNYSAQLSCEGKDIGITVTEPNKLGLTLQAVLAANFNGFSVQGKFKPEADLPEEVHQAAAIFGAPDADGYISFSL